MADKDSKKILQAMLDVVENNPGIRPRDINKKLGLEHSNHYRKKLIKQKCIRKERVGSAVHYYPINRNPMKIIAIAGGSGAGKSTVSYHLVDTYPEKFQILNFDDYQIQDVDENSPRHAGMVNWDHPDIIRWDDLIADIQSLKAGTSITIKTWSHRSNPDYKQHGKMKARTIEPKPILIVEGYLALHDPRLRSLYDASFYFDLDENIRNSRRDKDTIVGHDDYKEKVLKPMFKKYVEPTKDYVSVVIDVTSKTVDEIACHILRDLKA